MGWALDNLSLIGALTLDHLRQSLMAIASGFALSLPLGWAAWRYKRIRAVVLSGTGLLYTIPSLAMLLILPLIIGFPATSEINLVVALTIYAIAIMVQSVADGLSSVDPDTRRAAMALGYGPVRRFWGVDLPLAGPVIVSGLRVAAVSTIALATVGILVGVTNLGYLFTNGLQRRIIAEVCTGLVVVALLALVIDQLIVAAGRLLMPWTRSSRAVAHSRSRSKDLSA